MDTPNTPVTLTPEQVRELSEKLSHMRHDVNNHLALIVAAVELMRFKPETRDRMTNTLSEQAPKIIAEIQKFSTEFEQVFGVRR